jgi:hypothetical protein
MVQASLDKDQGPISKITRAEWVGGMAQMIKHLSQKAQNPVLKHKCQ